MVWESLREYAVSSSELQALWMTCTENHFCGLTNHFYTYIEQLLLLLGSCGLVLLMELLSTSYRILGASWYHNGV